MGSQDTTPGRAGRSAAGIRAKTLGGLAVLLGMLLAVSAVVVVDSWLAMRSAERAEARNALVGDLAAGALELAQERGLTTIALMGLPVPDRPDSPSLADQRLTADDRLRQALDQLNRQPDVVSADLQAELRAAIARIVELRKEVDAELGKPADRRDASVAAAWLPAISGLTELIRHAIGEQSAPGAVIDAQLQSALEIRMAAFDLRNAAGERSALLWGVIGSNRPVSLAIAVQIGSRAEATELHWRRLRRLTGSIGDPRLDRALDAAKRDYFGSYTSILEQITAAGLSNEPYSVTGEAYSRATASALQRLDDLVLVSQSIATEMLRDRARQATLRLLGSLAAVLAGIAVAGLSVIAFSRRVLRPIEQITGAMRHLAAGWGPDVALPTMQRDEIGEMSRAIAAFRDAMVASEVALAEAGRFTRQSMDALATHIAVLDGTGMMIATNRSWRDFGKSRSGPRIGHEGENYLAVCDRAAGEGDADAGAIAEGIRSVLRGDLGDFELEYACHDPPERRWFRMRVTPFAGDGPMRVVVAHDDITARKLAEEALQEKNRLLELAECMALTGHWRYDRQSGTLRWSHEIYRIYGFEPSDQPPDPEAAMSAYHPDDREIFERTATEAIEAASSFSLDLRLFRSDGELRDVEVVGDCELGEDGSVVALFGVFRDITERKRAAERLANLNVELERRVAEQTAVLHRAQDLAGVGHWSWSRDRVTGRWHTGLEYSAAVSSIFGVAPKALAIADEDYIARFVHPDDQAFVAEAFRTYWQRRKERQPLEYRIVRPDGVVRHIREVTENIPSDADRPGEVLGTVQDITERKEAELRLRQSEANLRAIFDHAPVTISLRDVAGRYVMINRRFREIFGRSEAEVLGRTPAEFYPERFVRDIRSGVEHVQRTRTTIVTEESAPTVHGDRRYLTTRFPILGDGGALTGIGSISLDITGERAAEAALRESEARLRAIYESEPDCVALLAQDGSWLEVNPAGLVMLGAAGQRDLCGRPAEELIAPDHRDRFRSMVAAVFGGSSSSLLFEASGLGGACRWLAANAVPMRDPDGSVTAMLMIARDVTAQRAVEEQLRQAQKMEAIGQLTGGIAHDFNNLLGVIVGNLDLLSLKLGRDSTEKDLVERAVAAAERGAALTHRLLAFARRQTLLPQHVDAGQLVTEMAQLLHRALGERIALRTEIEPELMPCYVDPAQLETALLNLCINARDAMSAGGILTVAARNEVLEVQAGADAPAARQAFVVISVSDTGEGMAQETRARAFEPFFTTKGVGKGSGLGLSMVYGFVEQSGGHVEIESEVGRGTTVSLHLRASAAPAQVGWTEAAGEDLPGAGQLVLVVEDEDPVRAFAVDALDGLGYRVVEAADGPAALAALRRHDDIAVLFTDIVLPGPIDGFALAARVRKLRPGIRVLYTTGFTDKEQLPAELLDGEAELLLKPYRVSELGRRIGRLFNKENV